MLEGQGSLESFTAINYLDIPINIPTVPEAKLNTSVQINTVSNHPLSAIKKRTTKHSLSTVKHPVQRRSLRKHKAALSKRAQDKRTCGNLAVYYSSGG